MSIVQERALFFSCSKIADHLFWVSNRPTVREFSVDSRANGENDATDDDSPTIYGDTSDKFNAKIIGYSRDGDVILRISPELSQELFASRPASSKKSKTNVRFDESRMSATPSRLSLDIEKQAMATEEETDVSPTNATSRPRRKQWGSSASITFIGKEKQQPSQDDQPDVNRSTEPPHKANGPPSAETGSSSLRPAMMQRPGTTPNNGDVARPAASRTHSSTDDVE